MPYLDTSSSFKFKMNWQHLATAPRKQYIIWILILFKFMRIYINQKPCSLKIPILPLIVYLKQQTGLLRTQIFVLFFLLYCLFGGINFFNLLKCIFVHTVHVVLSFGIMGHDLFFNVGHTV
jgi:hypothetical protein